ncbi:MAG: DUF3822 family protein [Bacteroidales bacterium]|nr:DUF3822 family protein [Bacteroidales bacterium]MBN2748670.1 DUF3822 family protein [Bacteroidales bacterium]
MLKIELFDETFDQNRTESYSLSIQACLNGFYFSVRDLVRDYFIVLVGMPFEIPLTENSEWNSAIDEMITKYPWLRNPFKKVSLTFESPLFTVIPTPHFEADKAKSLLELTNDIPPLYEVRSNDVEKFNATVVFALPCSLVKKLIDIHSSLQVTSYNAPGLHQLAEKVSEDKNIAYICLAEKFAAFSIVCNAELIHSGAFPIVSTEETIYHILNGLKQLSVDTQNTDVVLCGKSDEEEQLESLLGRFVQKTQKDSPEGTHFSYILSRQRSRFANLFNLSLCE